MTKQDLEKKCRFLEERINRIYNEIEKTNEKPEDVWQVIGGIEYLSDPENLKEDLSWYIRH